VTRAAALVVVALGVACLASACTGGKPRAPMSSGERLYLAKCTACHSAYEPAAYSQKQWIDNVDEMTAQKKVTLSPEERAEILAYLSGSNAVPPASAPAPSATR